MRSKVENHVFEFQGLAGSGWVIIIYSTYTDHSSGVSHIVCALQTDPAKPHHDIWIMMEECSSWRTQSSLLYGHLPLAQGTPTCCAGTRRRMLSDGTIRPSVIFRRMGRNVQLFKTASSPFRRISDFHGFDLGRRVEGDARGIIGTRRIKGLFEYLMWKLTFIHFVNKWAYMYT